ncbi:hypothetical protein GWK48_05580 [Metallosphaera tengchongensis]|uniref:Uncharacterized protein n=1 Tax=Metallosphaera tengchongensis TaxID=1532350 RepID=A0A6N0NUT3_9CREN|nr:hypothetical protein [Metallosphaera tengchongensis]QKQ99916.1 hypothetical protein GWK48_05580 [Metallosphaera tengchongensis]
MQYHMLAGSPYERRFIDELKGQVEDSSDEVRTYKTEVLYWESKYLEVIINGEKITSSAMPYSKSLVFKGNLTVDPLGCSHNEILLSVRTSLADIYYDIIVAREKGCQGVVLKNFNQNLVSVSPPYLQKGPTEPPLPLIVLGNGNVKHGDRIEIYLDSDVKISEAFSIHAIKNGKRRVCLVTNHDTWISRDNLRRYTSHLFKNLSRDPEVQWEYLSMSGIETGRPGFSSLYWNSTVEKLIQTKNFDIDLAIEIRGGEWGIEIGPGLRSNLGKRVPVEPLSISYELVRAGIPSIIYHVNFTEPSSSDNKEAITKETRTLETISKLNFNFSNKSILEDFVDDIKLLPPEIRSFLVNFNDRKLIQSKIILSFLGRYWGLPGNIKYGIFHLLLANKISRKFKITFAEDYPALSVRYESTEFHRLFRSELEKTLTKTYLDRMYNVLQEFL